MTENVQIAFCRRATMAETKMVFALLMNGTIKFGDEAAIAEATFGQAHDIKLGHELVPLTTRAFISAVVSGRRDDPYGYSLHREKSDEDDPRAIWRVWVETEGRKPSHAPADRTAQEPVNFAKMAIAGSVSPSRPWWQRMTQA